MRIRLLNAGILFLMMALAAQAQQQPLISATPEKKSRLLFEPGTNTPAPPKSTKTDPLDAAIDNFFLAVQAGQIDAAYDNLVQGSIYGERVEDINTLKKKTEEALKAFGLITGYELIQEKKAGTTLVRRTYLSLNERLPLRWRFYYYKTKDGWKMVDFRVDDGLVDLFDEIPKTNQ